jgi:rfaE bifunctional protein nucleotidyltransferase chain/domain
VVWDPHLRGAAPVENVYLTPNHHEAAQLAGPGDAANTPALDPIAQQATRLRDRFSCAGVAVTVGADGVIFQGAAGPPLAVPVAHRATGDTCGAGDAFAAAFAVALGDGAVPTDAVVRAVRFAGEYVAGGGPAHWRNDADVAALTAGATAQDVVRRAAEVRARGGRVVATSGCFDLLHRGHVEMLRAARAHGDHLVVCCNSDASVRRLKGVERPVQSEDDRAAILRELRAVDDVIVFDEDDPIRVLRLVRPHVFVKGGDYAYRDLIERDALAEWGCAIRIVPYHDGRSTTSLIERARTGVQHDG